MDIRDRLSNFQAEDPLVSPQELYVWFKQRLPADKKHIYITGPINSGGAVRLHSFEGKSPSEIATIIQLIAVENVSFANTLIKMLLKMRLLDTSSVITSPYHLGVSGERRYHSQPNVEAKTWTQSEYLLFWSMVISGLAVDVVPEFYSEVDSKMKDHSAKMNTIELSRKQRIEQYSYMEKVVLSALRSLPPSSVHPIEEIVRFPDSNKSLGSVFEQRIAQELVVPSSKVAFNLAHPYFTHLNIYKDKVFQCLLGVEDCLTVSNDEKHIFPISIQSANEVPNYKE